MKSMRQLTYNKNMLVTTDHINVVLERSRYTCLKHVEIDVKHIFFIIGNLEEMLPQRFSW